MFPSKNSGELSFQTTDFAGAEDDLYNIGNQIFWTNADASAGVVNTVTTNVGHGRNSRGRGRGRGGRGHGRGRGRGRRSASSPEDVVNVASTSNCNDGNDEQNRKAAHREIERQRRLEMSKLFSSLHSALPPEYTKGKRSTSDHLAEAVNYIKDLEKNVKELADRRDELKAASERTNRTYQVGGSSNPRPCRGSVMIEPRLGGIAIDIDVGYEDEKFLLSKALQVAYKEGLSVSGYTSTKNHDRLIHNIVCEVNGITCIDFSQLQWRLNDLIN